MNKSSAFVTVFIVGSASALWAQSPIGHGATCNRWSHQTVASSAPLPGQVMPAHQVWASPGSFRYAPAGWYSSYPPLATPGAAATQYRIVSTPLAVGGYAYAPLAAGAEGSSYVYFRPLIPLVPPPPVYYFGQGILGQPKVYVPGQPLRNVLRYLTP